MRIIAVALLLLFAGCLSPDPAPGAGGPDGPGDDVPAEADPEGNVVTTGTGIVVASAGVVATSQGGGDATVKTGARILLVEWAWEDAVVDLDGALSSPSAGDTQGVATIDYQVEGGSPGSPDSPHSLTITAPETGSWAISMIASGAAAQTEYRYAATVFYDKDAVPEGYSAL